MNGYPMTDLAVELKAETEPREEDGFFENIYEKDGVTVSIVHVTGDAASEKLGKPKGTYGTFDVAAAFGDSAVFSSAPAVIRDEMRLLMPKNAKSVLVAGLGNRALTADALGPKVTDRLIVTRHLKRLAPDLFRSLPLSEVSAVTTGVLGQTGIESAELTVEAVKAVKPDAVVVIDALAARDIGRLGTTVQISDTGLSPGSGVGNKRFALTRDTLGCPVLSVGVPTVVNAYTLCRDLAGREIDMTEKARTMIVTTKDIDATVDKASRLLAQTLNLLFHPDLTDEDRAMLLF